MSEQLFSQSFAEKFFKGYLPFLIIILFPCILYFQTIFFGFISLDEEAIILKNYSFISKPSNFLPAFLTDVTTKHESLFYRPVLIISFITDAFFYGVNPLGYHLTNIIIHIINCCLLFILFKKLKYPVPLSWFLSLIFAIHPVLTQAVGWIPGRNDSLLALFIIPSFIFFINFLETGKWKWISLHFLFFTLALFNKETGIVSVFILLFYWFIHCKDESIKVQNFLPSIMYVLIFWAIISTIWFWLRNNSIYHGATLISEQFSWKGIYNAISYLSMAYLSYIGKIIFPVNLSTFPTLQNANIIFGCVSLLLLTILFFMGKIKNFKRWTFGFFWFVLFLAPTIIFHVDYFLALFEHRLYLPFIGFMLMLLESEFIRKVSLHNYKLLLMCGSVLLLLSAKTITHLPIFKNNYEFWLNANETTPFYLTHQKLGGEYYVKGMLKEALQELESSIQLRKDNHEAFNQTGIIYLSVRQFTEAEKYFQRAIKINPVFVEAITNAGIVAYWQSDYSQAKKYFYRAIEIQPDFTKTYYNLGLVYRKEGKNDSAAIHFQNAIKYYYQTQDMTISKDFPANNYTLLGIALLEQNKLQEALFNFKKALEINPSHSHAYKGMAQVCEKSGNKSQADYFWEKAKQFQKAK